MSATAAAFGEDEKALQYLKPLLKSKQAGDANQWLAYLEMREGRYKAAAAHIQAGSDKPDSLAATFRELPRLPRGHRQRRCITNTYNENCLCRFL